MRLFAHSHELAGLPKVKKNQIFSSLNFATSWIPSEIHGTLAPPSLMIYKEDPTAAS
jgi:hypothetical protein